MYKIVSANKDTYVTDRVVKDVRRTSANVGAAGSLDLFKLYGHTTTGSNPNIELSRLLIRFDLTEISTLLAAGKIDTNHPSFSCHLKLFDVYGGQPTPRNFRVEVHPLSRSFDEGLGRDVVFYEDGDIANFLTGSVQHGPWLLSGANLGGASGTPVDYLTSAVFNSVTTSLGATQLFETGEEDLYVDVTTTISATLAGLLSNHGFRIALTSSLETDTHTYFVKRFAARTAYNEDKHPQLIIRFDDSITDDTANLELDASGTLFLYNYSMGTLQNLLSASIALTGSNCVRLRLRTEVSGGYLTFPFLGSQFARGGTVPITGIYSASVFISQSLTLTEKLNRSGSIKFTPIWGSIDGTVGFLTGSPLYVFPPSRGSTVIEPKKYNVSTIGVKPEYRTSDITTLRINIFDDSSPRVFKVKTPVTLPGLVIRNVYYAIRDVATNVLRVPFDKVKNSTKASADGAGMYFKLDCSNLVPGRSYVVDALVSSNDNDQVYRSISSPFRVLE